MDDHLTPRSLIIWAGTIDDIDAPILVQRGLSSADFTTLRAHGSFHTPDFGFKFKRPIPLLVTNGPDADARWPERAAVVGPMLRELGELT